MRNDHSDRPAAARPTAARHEAASGSPDERVGLLEFADRRALDDASLALAAQGFAWGVVAMADPATGRQRFVLTVPADQAPAAQRELAGYAIELRAHRDEEPAPEPIDSGFAGALGYAFLVGLAFLFQTRGAFGLDWRDAGLNVSNLALGAEPWRALTSLFLHADLPHLASNLLFGILFGVLLAHSVGSGVAWAAILVSGTVGNFANDFFQEGVHRSLGASTAVFAAVGLLVGVESIRRRRPSVGAARRYGPILLGAVLLAWFGGGGVQEGGGRGPVDVGAHVMGFFAGLSASPLLALAVSHARLRSLRLQLGVGGAAIALAVLCWIAAHAA